MDRAVVALIAMLFTLLAINASESESDDDIDVAEEFQYLKLHTVQQLTAMNNKLEWLLSGFMNKPSKGNRPFIIKDCADIQRFRKDRRLLEPLTGIYNINLDGGQTIKVKCDFTASGGGWTFIQQHIDNSIVFNRTWTDYEQGFGNIETNFWLGNHVIYKLTSSKAYSLGVDIWDWNNNHMYHEYDRFSISSPRDGYKLMLNTSSKVYNAMMYQNGMPFTTFDRDVKGCAMRYGGGWWFNHCYKSFPNGLIAREWNKGKTASWKVFSSSGSGVFMCIKRVQMKIRPINYL